MPGRLECHIPRRLGQDRFLGQRAIARADLIRAYVRRACAGHDQIFAARIESEIQGIVACGEGTPWDLRQLTRGRGRIDAEGRDVVRLRRVVDEEDPLVEGVQTLSLRLDREPRIDASAGY